MNRVFIIHGAYGNPEENWFPWLKHELENVAGADCEVIVPKFPTPEGQNLANWRAIFAQYLRGLDSESILVGHSIASAFLLDVIERVEVPIKAAFLVAAFAKTLGAPEVDEINRTFVERSFAWDKIKANCNNFFIYYSDNDPYVPADYSIDIADKLAGVKIKINGAGHFNTNAGYNKFELLLEDIKKQL
jgi:predicted alpha/beta hydrolase family esterase